MDAIEYATVLASDVVNTFRKNVDTHANFIGCPAAGGFTGDMGSMGCKTTADIHGGTGCYGGGVPLGKDRMKADCLVVHVVCRAVKNTAVVGSVYKREA